MRTSLIRAAAVVPLVLIGVLQLTAAGSQAAAAANVQTAREAWYESSVTGGEEDDPTCQLPTGCVPASTPVQGGEKTLQVGAAVGRDRARAFLSLNLDALPEGALVTGGTLTLPILPDDQGSLRPETARLWACGVLEPIKPAQGGSPEQEPVFDCQTSSPLRYDASSEPPSFRVDLGPVASALSFGGVAIVPSAVAHREGDTFQVAFPARGHASKAAITATVIYDPPLTLEPLPSPDPVPPQETTAPPSTPYEQPASDEPSFTPGTAGGSSSSPTFSSPPAPNEAAAAPSAAGTKPPLAAAPPVAQTTPIAPATVFYAYPGVWLVPLALLGFAGLLGRSLTGEIVLPDDGAAVGAATTAAPNVFRRVAAALRPPV